VVFVGLDVVATLVWIVPVYGFVVGYLGQSRALLADGLHSLTDLASDAAAVIAHTRDVVNLDDGDMATITRMIRDPATRDYVERRRAEGRTTKEIRRCLKRYLARQIYRHLNATRATPISLLQSPSFQIKRWPRQKKKTFSWR
jgi:hypothetical protein